MGIVINSFKMFTSPIIIIVGLFNIYLNLTWAEEVIIQTIPRVDLVHNKVSIVPAQRICFSKNIEAFVFLDLDHKLTRSENSQTTRQAMINVCDMIKMEITPKINEALGFELSRYPVRVIFDQIKDKTDPQDYLFKKKYNGYFSPREMGPNTILIDINFSRQGSIGLESIITHELLHLVQYHLDPNEEAFLNEGIALLFEKHFYNIIHQGGLYLFLHQPGPTHSLIDFKERKHADYAQSFLFFNYLNDHFGGIELIREILYSPLNGLESVHEVLKKRDIKIGKKNVDLNFVLRHFYLALLLNTDNYSVDELFSLHSATFMSKAMSSPSILNDSNFFLQPFSFTIFNAREINFEISKNFPYELYWIMIGEDQSLKIIMDQTPTFESTEINEKMSLYLVLMNIPKFREKE